MASKAKAAKAVSGVVTLARDILRSAGGPTMVDYYGREERARNTLEALGWTDAAPAMRKAAAEAQATHGNLAWSEEDLRQMGPRKNNVSFSKSIEDKSYGPDWLEEKNVVTYSENLFRHPELGDSLVLLRWRDAKDRWIVNFEIQLFLDTAWAELGKELRDEDFARTHDKTQLQSGETDLCRWIRSYTSSGGRDGINTRYEFAAPTDAAMKVLRRLGYKVYSIGAIANLQSVMA